VEAARLAINAAVKSTAAQLPPANPKPGGICPVVSEKMRPEFRRKKIELLVAEGINRTPAEKLCAPFK
jgi:hypothetical protein